MINQRNIFKHKKSSITLMIAMMLGIICAKKVIAPADSNYTDFNEIKKRGVLVATLQNDPISYQINENDTTGFQYELIKRFAQHHNLKLEIKTKNNIDEEIHLLQMGGCNIIADHIPHNADIQDLINMSTPLYSTYAVLVQNKSSINYIRNMQELARKRIVLTKSSPYRKRIANMEKEIRDSIFVIEERNMNAADIIRDIDKNQEKMTVCDRHLAESMQTECKNIEYAQVGFEQYVSFGIDKNTPALLDSINSWIEDFKQTKDFERLCSEYFNKKRK